MAPATLYGHVISAIETVCGMVFTAIMTGLLFVRFSKPRPKILFADQAVVTSHNCSPTLMVRVANGRMTLLTNATVRMGVLLFEESAEGHSLRRLHDLPLSNTSLPLFALTWTVMHEIDEESPLAGHDAERLEEGDARLFLSIEAGDHAIGALVHDMRIYTAAEVLFGMHYAEAVMVDVDPEGDRYTCPAGKELVQFRRTYATPRTGITAEGTRLYRASKKDCDVCELKSRCCPNAAARKIPRDLNENARDVARALASKPEYEALVAAGTRSRC